MTIFFFLEKAVQNFKPQSNFDIAIISVSGEFPYNDENPLRYFRIFITPSRILSSMALGVTESAGLCRLHTLRFVFWHTNDDRRDTLA